MIYSSILSSYAQTLGGVIRKAGKEAAEVSFLEGYRSSLPAFDSAQVENAENCLPPAAVLGNTTDFVSNRLGSTVNLVAATGKKDGSDGLDFQESSLKSRFILLDTAKKLLSQTRITFCMHSLPNKATGATVEQDIETGHSFIAGVARCGLGWTCPVCATKIAMGRREEIDNALKMAEEQGLQPYFVTYTASHTREDALEANLADMKKAIRWMRMGGTWQKIKSDYGIVGYIDSWEITWGFSNGWHAHMHEVIFAKAGADIKDLEKKIFERWDKSLSRLGLFASEKYGVKVVLADDDIASYLTKWSLKTEMTGSNFKSAKKNSFTPMGLLSLAEAGEKWAGKLYQEYARATKGKSAIRWSRGLRDLLELGNASSDQELADAEQGRKSRTLAVFPAQTWKEIQKTGRKGIIGELLVVAGMGKESLDVWLGAVFDLKIDIDGQVKRRREKIPL